MNPATHEPPLQLWLDDERPAPPGWTRAHTVDEAIDLILASHVFEAASLDHWLGDSTQPTGMDLLRWMTIENKWPTRLDLHTSDPHAWDRMRNQLRHHAPHLL